jgi:hypothetical protein
MLPKAFLCMVICTQIAGCAHSFLFDENRDAQAKAAVSAVTEAHVSQVVASLEHAYAEMASKEEESERQHAEQLFDWELTNISGPVRIGAAGGDDAIRGLLPTVKARLEKIGIKDLKGDVLDRLRRTGVMIAADQKELDLALTAFEGAIGRKFSNCVEVFAASNDPEHMSSVASPALIAGTAVDKREFLPLKFEDLAGICKRQAKHESDRSAFFESGEATKLSAELGQLKQRLKDYAAARQLTQSKFDSAKKAMLAVNRKSTPHDSLVDKVTAKATELDEALTKIRDLNDLAGKEVFASEKLERLEKLLATLAGTAADEKPDLSADELLTVTLVKDLPALADEADKLFADAAKPRLVPFVAALEYERTELDRIKASEAILERKIYAAQSELAALTYEAIALARVAKPFDANGEWQNKTLAQLNRELPEERKYVFLTALATYGDEVRRQRIEAAVWRMRRMNADYDLMLSDSKAAAAQWDGLMDMAARVLADYHAAGIKPDDLNEFFKALGLVTIGVGAAQ